MMMNDRNRKQWGLIAFVGIACLLLGLSLNRGTASSDLSGSMYELDATIDGNVKRSVEREVQRQVSRLNSDNGKVFPSVKLLHITEQKRILVTGAAGFVGSNLVDELMRQGHIVYAMDNFFTGRRSNIEQWIGHRNFEFIHHDVVEPYLLEVDQIYHLACPASPPHYQYAPIKTIKTGVMGTMNMLEMAKRSRARLLFTSTSEIYGDPEVHPQPETYHGNVNPIGPRACYDESKRIGETMCYAYAQDGVEVRVARIFNTFGPRMHPNDGRVVSNFILQALQKKPLTIYGTGEQTRSFQYVDDLVSGLIKLMNSNYNQPVNLGNPEEFTIKDFAEMIVQEIDPSVKIMNLPGTKDDPSRRKPDITVAKRELNWEPKVHVRTGIKKTIEYFKAQLLETGNFEPIKPEELVTSSKKRRSGGQG